MSPVPGFRRVGSSAMKYAASPETIPVAMEVPSRNWLPVPTLSAHSTSTPGAHTATKEPCCEWYHSCPSVETAPTTMISGHSAAKSAGYVLTAAEPPGSFCTGQSRLCEYGRIMVNESGYPRVPCRSYNNSIECEQCYYCKFQF